MTLESFISYKDQFLIHMEIERRLALNTLKSYTGDLELFISFWEDVAKTYPAPLSLRTALERYLVSLYYKRINNSSIARKFSCFRSFERYMLTHGVNLNLELKRPRVAKKLPRFLTIDEINHLLDGVKDEELGSPSPIRDKTVLEILYATGIRCSELISIRLEHIDMREKTMRIRGKGNKERIVLFGNKAKERIIDYLSKERSVAVSQQEPLLINYRGEQLTSRSIQRILLSFRKFLTSKRIITPHLIRHSYATHLLSAGADMRVVQELLGHSSLSSTQIYTQITPEDLTHMCETMHPVHDIIQRNEPDS